MTKLKHFFTLLWKNFIHWMHSTGSTRDFVIKLIIAVFIFIIISDYLKKAVEKIEGWLSKGERPGRLLHFILCSIRFIILTGLLYEISEFINKVEVDPLVTITACSCVMMILVIQGVMTKLISGWIQALLRMFDEDAVVNVDSTVVNKPKLFSNSSTGTIIRFFLKLFRKLIGFGIAVVIVYVIYQGIFYLTDSGGFEVARMLPMSESKIEKELDTSFHEDNSLIGEVTQFPESGMHVMTDGHLNIVYENNVKVAVNTSSRKYKFYGIGINQPQIENSKRMSYNYDGVFQRTEDTLSGISDTYYYYNRKKNDCLAITVNSTSNRVVNLTYYCDFERIEGKLNSLIENGE